MTQRLMRQCNQQQCGGTHHQTKHAQVEQHGRGKRQAPQYRKSMEPTNRYLDYLAFVAFFPTVTAGPIVRELMSYLRNRKLVYGPREARELLVKMGEAAVPELEIGAARGDVALKRACEECLAAIRKK